MKYQVFPLKKMSYAVKIEFLSFTCEGIKVAMTSSMSATSKYYHSIACVCLFILKSGALKNKMEFSNQLPNFDINFFDDEQKERFVPLTDNEVNNLIETWEENVNKKNKR